MIRIQAMAAAEARKTLREEVKQGDKLLFVPTYGEPEEVDVRKAGRKWLALSNGLNADRQTLAIDGKGFSRPGVLWVGREAYESFLECQRLLDKIHRMTKRPLRRPTDLESARKAYELLAAIDMEDRESDQQGQTRVAAIAS